MKALDTYSLIICLIGLVIYALKDFIIRTYKCYKLKIPSLPAGYPVLGIVPLLLGNSQEG
jgi:hypothetical protein